jgi:hypothetical protein
MIRRLLICAFLLTASGSIAATPFGRALDALHAATPELHLGGIDVALQQFATVEAQAPELAEIGSADLGRWFDAVYSVAFYSGAQETVDRLQAVHTELDRRDLATVEQHQHLHQTLVQMRRFEAANALARAHPEASDELLPAIESAPGLDAAQPSLLQIDPVEPRLRRVPATLAGFTGIVAVASPGCHFSRNAVGAIERDPTLRELFERHARWWIPPYSWLHLEHQQAWNREHPLAAMSLVYAVSDWPQLVLNSLPTFHFLRDGVLVGTVSGWPKEGSRNELLEQARAIGLVD